ncbi:PDR/VanB family oxidoreductase [Raoultella planticola]|uniref:PDR/VanB family oxidoreductase n=1 Tax=Raoultella planticola TaxID=575 RepID=UPI0010528D19|nr:PDR/VanB family oxidoreductase [Raoultella planticola]EJR0224526.1 oxidoreductase [Raoultella planticola]EJR0354147.1 oxidoreductase [Raoultella planticola]MDV1446076.1 PDR/VanB family oxidoreductase [Raoultella planticola]MDV1562060.1 PDR/VanB family oxidoreductase [Raoultella planticola]MDV1568016.1 PDR/VanB family oxidoreductase [Raoultella planticola]
MSDVLKVVVDGLWREGDKSLAIKLLAQDGRPLPGWLPGAHIDVHLPCGIIRQYSLTGRHAEAGADAYLICVSREGASRGGSRYIHETLRPGQTLLISPPRNLFALQPARQVTLLAAGIGITPLYTMALHLDAAGTPFELHYYVKRRENAAFVGEMAKIISHGTCVVHCSDEGQSPRASLADTLGDARADHHLYLCGPSGFMDTARRIAAEKNWPEAQVHSEAFQPLKAAATSDDQDTFTVTLASSGETWPVPGDKTIAQVLQEHGVAVPLSCEMGMCGACLTPLMAGEADHRDTVQSEAEKSAAAQQIALCCSRSRSANLVIDL